MVVAGILMAALVGAVIGSGDEPSAIKVMTYNLRYATAPDGENSWKHRRGALLKLIQKHDPDVLGVQEALASQIDDLRTALPGHDVVGVGRDDGIRAGEHSAIFTRRSRFGLREGGTRWISDQPSVPGSLGSTAKLTRVFSWGEFFLTGGQRVLLMNCHLDHISEGARLLGAQQMKAFSAARPEIPALILGDFNCGSESSPIMELTRSEAFTDAKPRQGPFGTFNGFDPKKLNGDMIDHILTSPVWEIVDVQIDRTLAGNRTPSDHWPLVAWLKLRSQR